MKRRLFIKYSALASGGLLLASNGALALSKSTPYLGLPDANHHVRHGLFSLSEVKNPFIPSWLKVYDRHRFLANGYASGVDDFEVVSFKIEGESITIGYSNTEAYISFGERVVESKRTTPSLLVTEVLEDVKVKLVIGNRAYHMPAGKASFVLLLDGEAEINKEHFESGAFITLDEKDRSGLHYNSSDRNTLALVIETLV